MVGWMVGWMNGWMDGWMDRWMDGWIPATTDQVTHRQATGGNDGVLV